MPTGNIPDLGDQVQRFQDIVWRYPADKVAAFSLKPFTMAISSTRALVPIDTEFGRIIPTPVLAPSAAAGVEISNSKKLTVSGWMSPYVGFCVQINFYEDSDIAGAEKILTEGHTILDPGQFRINYTAVNRYVFIQFVNVKASAITDGDITTISRIS